MNPLHLLALTLLFHSCAMIEKQIGIEEDNVGEEIIEDVIKYESGIDIDLTPDSKEK